MNTGSNILISKKKDILTTVIDIEAIQNYLGPELNIEI
jgi:hypothetical protein